MRALRIVCTVDGKFERRDQFSQNELKRYTEAKRKGNTVHMRCRKHTQGSVFELVCKDCGQAKALNHFSNAARKVNGSRRCRDCVSWTESDLAGTGPLPAPGAVRAPNEFKFERRGHQGIDEWQYSSLDQATSDGLHTGLASMTINDNTSSGGHDTSVLTSAATKKHTREQPDSRPGAGYNPSSAPSDLVSTVGLGRTRPSGNHPAQYTAYGPNGEAQKRAQSVITGSDGPSAVSTVKGYSRGGFAKVEGRKTAPDPPNYLINEHSDEQHRYYYSDDESSDEA